MQPSPPLPVSRIATAKSSMRVLCFCTALLSSACWPGRPAQPQGSPAGSSAADKEKAVGAVPSPRAAPALDTIVLVTTDTTPAEGGSNVTRLVVERRRFTLHQRREPYGTRTALRSFRLVDEDGDVHYEQRFEPPARGERFSSVEVHVLRSERDEGVLLYYHYDEPNTPRSSVVMRILAMNNGRLTPITPHLLVEGRLRELQKGENADAMFLPGERVLLEIWQSYFALLVPFRVRLADCTPGRQQCFQTVVRRGDIVPGLSIVDVHVGELEIRADSAVVDMFDGPEGKALMKVTVRRNSRIAVLQGAADIYMEKQGELTIIKARRDWLHVRIHGREGWIRGTASYKAIGLKPS